MFIPFEELPEDAKVWIYIADKQLNDEECNALIEKIEPFLGRWKSEGKEFKSGYRFLENQILVVGGTASGFAISGCAMDALLKTVKKWEESIGVDFTTIPKFCYRNDGKIKTGNMAFFKKAVEEGEVLADTIVLDNTIQNLSDYKEKFEVPASKCWHKRLLKK